MSHLTDMSRTYSAAAKIETDAYVAMALYRDAHPERGALDSADYRELRRIADEACRLRRELSATLDRLLADA